MTGGDVLDRNHRAFSSLLDAAEKALGESRAELATVRSQVAATFAWKNPAGIFASERLEKLLSQLGAHVPPSYLPEALGPRVDIGHVVTQVYESGGSTQGLTSWLEQDRSRTHTVILTRQGTNHVPAKLLATIRSPGTLVRVDQRPGGLLARAAALRAAVARCGIVLLHAHPDDVIPVLAFADRQGPPLVSVNHADHVFWVGVSVAQTLMNMRDSGQDLAISRRGVALERCHVMARPLRLRTRTISRASAKSLVGVDPAAVVIATAADGSKYRSIGGLDFVSLVLPILEQSPQAILLAAGPTDEREWRSASEATGGRVRALGRLRDVSVVLQAADMYIDSFPFSSLTSLLEAGSYGVPVASFKGHPEDCAVLGADTRGIDPLIVVAREPDAFQEAILALLADAERREALGARCAAEIEASHSGEGWRRSVDALYAFASAQPPLDSLTVPPRNPGLVDVLVEGVMARTNVSHGVDGALAANLTLMPTWERLRTWCALKKAGQRTTISQLAPEWMRSHLAASRDAARQLLSRRHAVSKRGNDAPGCDESRPVREIQQDRPGPPRVENGDDGRS